jgi:hypothetical protein
MLRFFSSKEVKHGWDADPKVGTLQPYHLPAD